MSAPRGQLFEHPENAPVWSAVLTLSPEAQFEFLDVLQELLACAEHRSPADARKARAISDLREAERLLREEAHEGALTPGHYRRLYTQQGRALGWAPEASIRRWFDGAWNEALAAARLAPDPESRAVSVTLGAGFTREELVEALQACALDLGGVFSTSQYLAWAKRPEVLERPGRRPLSLGPFVRVFRPAASAGSQAREQAWISALRAADVLAAEGPAVRMIDVGGTRRPAGYRYQPEEIHEALRLVAQLLGRSPRTAEYQAERERIFAEQQAAGEALQALPSYTTIHNVYPVWDAALCAAGLAPLGGRGTQSAPAPPRASQKQYTREQLIAALRDAHAAKGTPFTVQAYKDWRDEQLERDPLRKLPGIDALRDGLGRRWRDCLQAALPELYGPTPAQETTEPAAPTPAAPGQRESVQGTPPQEETREKAA